MDPSRRLARWWGPNGFSITTHEMQFKEDGFWGLTMHGPDGRDYKNKIIYLDIREPEFLAYRHAGEPGDEPGTHHTEVHFKAIETNVTRVTMTLRFASAADLKFVIDTYGADKGGIQTFGRLADYVDSDPN
jgi:uncharacterized protein YndB with AHSA1/START domain